MSDVPELFEPDQTTKSITQLSTQELSREDRLLEKVLDSGNIEILERFIALREKEEARQAEREFNLRFAEMQKDFVIVYRIKKADGWKYAPLEELQKENGPIIARHGFSYDWSEELVADGAKRVVLTIRGFGYSKTNHFDVPKIAGTQKNNAAHVAGIMTKYGQRMTFTAGFGIIVADEDTDGIIAKENIQWKLEIENCETIEALKECFRQAYLLFKSDPAILSQVNDWKEAQKRKIESAMKKDGVAS